MVKTFEQKAKEMCEISTANTRKWRLRAEANPDAAQKLEVWESLEKMTQKELDEKELIEILELAKEAEQKARKMCETITANTAKYKSWYEARKATEVAAQK